jgi:UrcA family protein
MTRTQVARAVRRLPQRLAAGAAAIAMTSLMLVSVSTRAAELDRSTPAATVNYAYQDLNSEAEIEKLYADLKRAARKVCKNSSTGSRLDSGIRARRCYDEALANAVRQIDKPLLSALHSRDQGAANKS